MLPRRLLFGARASLLLGATLLIAAGNTHSLAELRGVLVLPEAVAGALEPSARVVLDGGVISAPVRSDNSFALMGIGTGEWIMSALVHDVDFPTFKVVVSADGGVVLYQHTVDNDWHLADAVLPPSTLTASSPSIYRIQARSTHSYHTPRPTFNPLTLLLNPYILMMGISMVMMFALPRMMAGMDPRDREEMERTQREMGGLGGGLLAGMMSGGGPGAGAGGADLAGRLAEMMAPKPEEGGEGEKGGKARRRKPTVSRR